MSWQVLGWANYRTENWQASVEALEKSCNLQGNGVGDAFQWFFLAMAHWQLGDKEEARQWYEKAVESYPGSELQHRFRAEAAELLGIENEQ